MTIQSYPVYTIPALNVAGLVLSWASNTTLSIAAGQCRDSTDTIDIILGTPPLNGATTSAPFTLNGAINGAGGLDTGTLTATKCYAIFLIGDSSYNKPVSAILTLGTNASPLMPIGYDSYRRIGFWSTDSSAHFNLGYYAGNGSERIFVYDGVQQVVNGGTQTNYTAIDLTNYVPQVDNTPVRIRGVLNPTAASQQLLFQPFGATQDAIVIVSQVNGVLEAQDITIFAKLNSTAPTINYKVSASNASVYVVGFTYYI